VDDFNGLVAQITRKKEFQVGFDAFGLGNYLSGQKGPSGTENGLTTSRPRVVFLCDLSEKKFRLFSRRDRRGMPAEGFLLRLAALRESF
jgi:hypothetical protein